MVVRLCVCVVYVCRLRPNDRDVFAENPIGIRIVPRVTYGHTYLLPHDPTYYPMTLFHPAPYTPYLIYPNPYSFLSIHPLLYDPCATQPRETIPNTPLFLHTHTPHLYSHSYSRFTSRLLIVPRVAYGHT